MKRIQDLLDAVEWTEVPDAAPSDDGTPYATHTGVLTIGEFSFRCVQLSNGTRVLNAEDVEAFFASGGQS